MSWCYGSYFKLLRALDGDGKAWYIIHTKRMYGGWSDGTQQVS